jgi:flagellar biosynthesis/type III secretory pathway M-ring protein FliF/YscJ
MAVVDLYFSAMLKAEFRDVVTPVLADDAGGQFIPVSAMSPAIAVMQAAEAEESIHMVESALNSRYMQWGAVGVMLMLFCWIVTKQQPNQERRRAEESAQIRDSFLKSIEKRDEQYLTALSEIRKSVELHVERVIDAKERQTEAFHELAGEVRSRG